MFNYDIGGQERKTDVSEGIAEIPQNRTLFIEKLSDEPPLSPSIVTGLKSTIDVFAHFKPEKTVSFESEEGSTINETLSFSSLADFGKQGITKQSACLNELNQQCDDLQKVITQLKSNRILRTVLENPEAKAAYLAAIQGLIHEIDQNII